MEFTGGAGKVPTTEKLAIVSRRYTLNATTSSLSISSLKFYSVFSILLIAVVQIVRITCQACSRRCRVVITSARSFGKYAF